MISRRLRMAFYSTMGPLMWLNGKRHYYFSSSRFKSKKVHLGPGQLSYLDGWVNVDANMFTGKCDVWVDLRNSLPFLNGSVAAFYSHHFIEHLPDLRFHFAEMYRVLEPGGVIRVGGPNGDLAIQKFVEGDLDWFSDFPEKRKSIGGRFENFIFCRNEHLTILTKSWLTELAEDAGFEDIAFVAPELETRFPEIYDNAVLQTEHKKRADPKYHITIMLECRKPLAVQ